MKVKRWIGFFYGVDGRLVIQGSGMHPALYKTKKEALERTANDGSVRLDVEAVKITVEKSALEKE